LERKGANVIWIAIWLVCAIGAAIIAGGKGRSAMNGFWAGLVLGPIGVLIALGLPDEERKIELELHRRLRPCPVCAERIQPAALKCRFCGADTAPAPGVFNADNPAPGRPPMTPEQRQAAAKHQRQSDLGFAAVLGVLALIGLVAWGLLAMQSRAPRVAIVSPRASTLAPWPFGQAPAVVVRCKTVDVGSGRLIHEQFVAISGRHYAINWAARDRLGMPSLQADYPAAPDLSARAAALCGRPGELRSAELVPG